MGFFKNLMGEGSERELFGRSAGIVRHAQKASGYLDSVVRGKPGMVERIRLLKGESGRQVFELSNSISGGAIAPNLIDDFMRFVYKEDQIVDNIFILARAMSRYKIRDRRAAAEVRAKMLRTMRILESTLNALLKMHDAETTDEARKLRIEIERFEHEDDELKESLLDLAYGRKLDYKDFYQVTNVAYLSDDIIDSCKDSSDMLLGIMLAILT